MIRLDGNEPLDSRQEVFSERALARSYLDDQRLTLRADGIRYAFENRPPDQEMLA